MVMIAGGAIVTLQKRRMTADSRKTSVLNPIQRVRCGTPSHSRRAEDHGFGVGLGMLAERSGIG